MAFMFGWNIYVTLCKLNRVPSSVKTEKSHHNDDCLGDAMKIEGLKYARSWMCSVIFKLTYYFRRNSGFK